MYIFRITSVCMRMPYTLFTRPLYPELKIGVPFCVYFSFSVEKKRKKNNFLFVIEKRFFPLFLSFFVCLALSRMEVSIFFFYSIISIFHIFTISHCAIFMSLSPVRDYFQTKIHTYTAFFFRSFLPYNTESIGKMVLPLFAMAFFKNNFFCVCFESFEKKTRME